MTNLNCAQGDCANNSNGCCCLNTIEVDGSQNAVCCSYCTGSGASDTVKDAAQPATEIECGEQECCHNENCCCQSDHVEIGDCSCGPKCRNFER